MTRRAREEAFVMTFTYLPCISRVSPVYLPYLSPSPSPIPSQVQAYCIGLLFDEIRALRREFYDTEVRP